MATFVRHLPDRLHPGTAWRRRIGAVVLGLLAGLSSPAFAQAGGVATLEPPEAMDSPLTVTAGEDLPLAVVRRQDGAPVGGDHVDWRVSGPEGALLTPERSTTSATTDADGAGIARTRFRAGDPGHYTVTAASQTNPGCAGEGCAQYVESKFDIDVTPVAVADDGSRRFSNKALGAVAATVGALALLSAGGGGDNDDETSGAGQTLAIQGGNNQSALPNAPLPVLLSVRADNNGSAAAGVVINWTASGGATLSTTTTTTTSFGLAGVFVTSVGPGPGPITVTATRADSGAQVTFNAVVLTPELQQVSGDGQSAPTSTTVPSPLVVRALLGGNPQAGVTINWTVTSGDATIGSVSNGGVTDGSGQNSATVDLGPTPGTVVVTAARNDFPGVTQSFVINSTLTRTLSIVSGDGQTAAPNAPLPAPLVVNAQNNGAPIAGVTINWSATGGATLSATTSTTNASGDSQVTVTSTGPGPDPVQVTAVRADDGSAVVFFNESIVPPTLAIVAGDGQSGLINSAATTAMEVVLLDGASQPVPGQAITWQVTGGSALLGGGTSTTDGAGHATMTFSYGSAPGPITIHAYAYAGSPSVDFNQTAVGPTGGSPSGGNNQSGNPGDTLPTQLTVTINPPAGVTDLSGVNVFWQVTSGTASVSPPSSVTDASGQASTTLTLGLTPGPVTVVATIEGDGSVVFNATISGSLVSTTLTKVSGDAQTLATGVQSAPMEVQLLDSGTPLSGQTITWSTDNGTVAGFSSTTDAQGKATMTVTPTQGGPVNVTANFAAVAQYTASSTTFVHNATISSIPTLTTDEAAVAEALDSACADLQAQATLTPEEQDLLNQCLALGAASGSDPEAVGDALEEMLPDVAETQTQTSETAVNAQIDNLTGRLATLRAGNVGNSFGGLALAGPGGRVSLAGIANSLLADDTPADDSAGEEFSRWGVFASGTIGRGENAQGDNVPKYDFDINGITLGVDYRKTDNLVIGAAVGYTRQDTTLSGGEGSLDMRGVSLSAYGSWYLQRSWYVDGALSFAHNSFDHRRRIFYTLPGSVTVDQQARADSGGNDRSLSLSFGRDFNRGAWGGSGYGRLLYSRQSFDGFEEELEEGSAGSGLGLRVDDRSTTALSTVLGGKLTYTHSADWGVLVPQVQLEWQKEHKSDPELFRAFLIDDPTGTPILVTGTPLDSSYFRFGVGLSMVLTRGRSGFVLYEKMLGRDGMDLDNLSLGFRMEF